MATRRSQFLEEFRHAIRPRHYSIRTEQAYVDWIRRFIFLHGKRHPHEMGEADVCCFLTHLVPAWDSNPIEGAVVACQGARRILRGNVQNPLSGYVALIGELPGTSSSAVLRPSNSSITTCNSNRASGAPGHTWIPKP